MVLMGKDTRSVRFLAMKRPFWLGQSSVISHQYSVETPHVFGRAVLAGALEKPQGRSAGRALRGFGGSLGAVESVEETGEGLGVRREVVRTAKVPGHFAHHIGLTGVIPFLEEVIVNADGEQHILMFAVFLLQGALDFANDGRALKRMLGADHHQLVIMPSTGSLRLPMMSWVGVDYWPPVPASKNRSSSPSTN